MRGSQPYNSEIVLQTNHIVLISMSRGGMNKASALVHLNVIAMQKWAFDIVEPRVIVR